MSSPNKPPVLHIMHPLLTKGRWLEKNMVLGDKFQKLRREGVYYRRREWAGFSKVQGGAKLLEWTIIFLFFLQTCYFYVFLYIIIMYVLISLIQQDPWQKTIMALFSHTTIKCCFGWNVYSKCCINAYLCSCSVLVEEWCWILLDFLFDIALLL